MEIEVAPVEKEDEEIIQQGKKRIATEETVITQESNKKQKFEVLPFSSIKTEESWKRNKLPEEFNASKNGVIFQQMQIDYVIEEGVPVIKMYGLTQEGYSVALSVYNFMPYMWIAMPPDSHVDPTVSNYEICENLREGLENRLTNKTGGGQDAYHKTKKERRNYGGDEYDDDDGDDDGSDKYETDDGPKVVTRVEIMEKMDIMLYHEAPSKFFRIEFSSPQFVRKARTILEDEGLDVIGLNRGKTTTYQTYESNIAFVLRMMIDCGIVGGGWVGLPAGKYKLLRGGQCRCKTTIEAMISYRDLVAYPADDEDWAHMAPLRSLSFDIECASVWPAFPNPEQHQVIQIANYVAIIGQQEPLLKNIFMLGTCLPIPGVDVRCFVKEADMLAAWSLFVNELDPDFLTGYNIEKFDFPYLIDRAKVLKLKTFANFSRLRGIPVSVKDTKFSSIQTGTRESKEWNITGRIVFDMYKVLQKDHKLSSYTLNAVATHFLKEQKEDVHPSLISELFSGTPDTRRRLATYCCKDAFLPQKLIDELMCVVNYVEMARVTGIPFIYLLTRGQGIKVVSQILRRTRQLGYLMPTVVANKVVEGFEGAKVLDPEKGFYEKPVATLDFSSLYPSIMLAHNFCYTTLLKPGQEIGLVKDVDYEVTPMGHRFLKAEKKKGILCMILEDLLKARGAAKNLIKTAKTKFQAKVFDGRQLAIKMSANSVYGFTGQANGQLPCLEISSSVTAYGRDMILFTKAKVEEIYSKKNGYPYDAKVLYGDTDSVMVLLDVKTVEEAIAWGQEAAPMISSFFTKPIALLFEKVYYPYLLMSKKKYAGLYWTKPDKPDKLDAKGIESVRRDNCGLARYVVETVLKKIIEERDITGAVEFSKGVISDILKNKIDLSLLIITKAYSKDAKEYKNPQAHIALAEKMKERNPATAPSIGERIPYVITKGEKKSTMCSRVESPLYVLEHDIPIDTNYYIDQLISPLCRLFKPILPNPKEVFTTGEHTRELVVPRAKPISSDQQRKGSLSNFLIIKESCLGCRAPLHSTEKTLCIQCRENQLDIYMKYLTKQRQEEMEFTRLWTQCQRCQGSFHREVVCAANDCGIFYKRVKAQKDLVESRKIMSKFNLDW